MAVVFAISNVVFAQKGLELTVKHNVEIDRYEVYAKPNFTQRNYLLGPSQITLSLPASLQDEKLRIQNVDGGTWEDNTDVYAPAAKHNTDFHAVTSLGAKTDFIEGNETLLFYFSLPKTINPSVVSLFENGIDPNSAASGMKGGDFSNAMYDAYAEEIYQSNYKQYAKKQLIKESDDLSFDVSNKALTLYPNIATDHFSMTLKGVADSEEVTITVSTEAGRILIKETGVKKVLEEKKFLLPSVEASNQNLVVRVKTNKTVFGQRLIVEKE